MSSLLCKLVERVSKPLVVLETEDGVDDPIATGGIVEAAHGPGAPAHLAKDPFNGIGRAYNRWS